MIMRNSVKILAITALTLMATSCYFRVPKNGGNKSIFGLTRGDGNVIDKEYVVEPFDKIHNEAALDIRFAQDSSTMVRIHADSNIVELLDVSVEDGTLTIKTEANNLIFEGESYIYVACPSIKEVHGSGSGDFDMQDFRLDSLALAFSGSGDIFLKDGSVNWLSISTSGSGDIKMDGINGKDVKCETAGSGDISISGEVKNLKARTAGSGDIDIRKLKYESKDVSTSGSGDVFTE